jgi:hypothetical protein
VECPHDHEVLEFVVQCTSRGAAPNFHLKCKCGGVWTGSPAIKLVLDALSREVYDLWKAVKAKGGSRPVSLQPAKKEEKGPCPHFASWLRVKTAGRSAGGHTESFSVRCMGCKQSWGMADGFKMLYERLSGEQAELRKAIRALP